MNKERLPGRRHVGALLLLVIGFGGSAVAVDGVIEINHVLAQTGGVTAGDTPGYPVSINESGSYRLTSNLVVTNADTNAISVSVDNVAIDLNGFSILGPVECTGDPVTGCTASGNGDGVDADARVTITSVRNGTIRGMGGFGLNLEISAHVRDVVVMSNGNGGVFCRNNCSVEGSRIVQNLGRGIWQSTLITPPVISAANAFRDNVIAGNGEEGIVAGVALVVDNHLYKNAGVGLSLSSGGYSGNLLWGNNGGSENPQANTGLYAFGANRCGIQNCP